MSANVEQAPKAPGDELRVSSAVVRTMEITPNILYYDGRQSCLSDRQIVSSYGRRMVQATSQLMCVKCLGPFRDTIPLFYTAIISLTIHRAPSTLHNTPASGREI